MRDYSLAGSISFRYLALWVAILVTETAFGLAASVPGPGQSTPQYFAGTKARAKGHIQATLPGEDIVKYRLWLNDELVVDVVRTHAPPLLLHEVWPAVMFDSSFFSNGTDVTVKVEGWNQHGGYATASQSVVVKNRIVAFNDTEFEETAGGSGSAELFQHMAGLGYGWEEPGPGWTSDNVSARLQNPGIWYVNSHGGSDLHATDVPDDAFFAQGPNMYAYDYARESWNGTNLPPFNSTGDPYVAYAQLDACCCGVNGLFQTVLYPYFDAYDNQNIVDQAVLSWPGDVYISEAENRVWWMFGAMRYGATAWAAAAAMIANNSNNNHRVRIHTTTNLVDSWEEVKLQGDPFTRIKTVYKPSHLATGLTWYRNITE